ncbi:MAG: outer membrane protein assembly factor BamA [Campylobacterota bacterium]|nr:outer membrane protein assembly factor BamA [Campylobacterota bacterium]
MIMKKIVLACILPTTLLLAQKVTQVKYEGLAHLSPSVASEITDIHVGDNMDADKINRSIKKLFAQGYFQDVWVDKKGGQLTYHFTEKVAIANLEIKGYGTGDDGVKLLETIGLKKGDLYDARRAGKAKATIISRLESQGYYDTVVEASTTKINDSSVSIVFDVNKGEKIKIKKMNFIGASALSQSDIELDLANKESDILGWMPFRNNGVASIDQLEYDALRVKDAYMKHGYLDVQVGKPLMRVDFGSYSAEVDYQIKEGPQYRLGDIAISNNIPGLDIEAIKNELSMKKGKIFNIKRMRNDMKKLKEAVGNLGYAYANVSPQMRKDAEEKVVSIQYALQAGQEVTINDVLISGNNSTKDRVIRRYLYLAPGDKFNATDLKDSKNALGRTGFFEKTDIQSQRISADKINLLVKVKEAPTGTISAGGGYGSYEKLMLNASYSEKNAFGSGISTNIGFDFSKISTNYHISFTNPKVWDSQYSMGLSLYKKKYEYTSFTQDQLGGSLTLGREFLRHFRASVGLGYIDNKSESTDNNTSSTVAFDNNGVAPTQEVIDLFYGDKYKKTSIFTSLSFDNTDDFYVPREGMIAGVNFEFAGLDGDMVGTDIATYPKGYGSYVKTSAKLGFYYGVEDWIDYDLILRFKARASSIDTGEGEKIPVAEKLFMGGIGSVRGYQPYSLSPKTNGLVSGGKKRASTTIEASIPLSQAAKMRLAAFYDYGMIGEDNFDEIKRSSAGVVIEWQSAFGPINLVFAKALDKEKGDSTSSFEFSMGTKF